MDRFWVVLMRGNNVTRKYATSFNQLMVFLSSAVDISGNGGNPGWVLIEFVQVEKGGRHYSFTRVTYFS